MRKPVIIIMQITDTLILLGLKRIQWNLLIKDTLGLGFCPFNRGCPLFRGYKCIVGIQKQAFGTTTNSVL